MLLATIKANSQDCTKFVQPKFETSSQELLTAYNESDYQFVVIVAGRPPITKSHYKTITLKDGYTTVDLEKSKALGQLCTKWIAPVTKVVFDYVEIIQPATLPQMAWVKKVPTSTTNTITTQKTIKDGYITISNCN